MNTELLQTFFAILEAGSLNQAAERLRVSQPTLTRRLQALEQVVGGQLLERSSSGVVPTATGLVLRDAMLPLLAQFDSALREIQRFASGQRAVLRLGYSASAASVFLNAALAGLREIHPEMKVQLRDLSPGEQVVALRAGEIDLALTALPGGWGHCEFYSQRLALLPVVVALPAGGDLAARSRLTLADLKGQLFIGAPDADVPGHNQWVVQLCRRVGFRPRFALNAESLAHGLSSVVTDGAVLFVPDYLGSTPVPGVAFRPLDDDSKPAWDVSVIWQRGRLAEPVRILVELLARNARQHCLAATRGQA